MHTHTHTHTHTHKYIYIYIYIYIFLHSTLLQLLQVLSWQQYLQHININLWVSLHFNLKLVLCSTFTVMICWHLLNPNVLSDKDLWSVFKKIIFWTLFTKTYEINSSNKRWKSLWTDSGNKVFNFLDFKLSPCFICSVFSFGYFPGIWVLIADVSEHSVGSIFIGRTKYDTSSTCLWRWNR